MSSQLRTSVGNGSSGHGSTILVGSGQVGSRVSVTDPVSDPVFVVFARALLLHFGREYATLESLGLIMCNYTRHFKFAVILS